MILSYRNSAGSISKILFDFADIDSYLTYLSATFPNFVQVEEFGRSTEGRPMKVVKLHQDTGRANKKAILIDAGNSASLPLPLTIYVLNTLN